VSYYAESPFDRIVNVHWKKKDDGGGGPGTWHCDGDCGSGWFPMANFFPGGDGFPPQLGLGNADLFVGPNVQWNPHYITEGAIQLFGLNQFVVPGCGATSVTISVVWASNDSVGLIVGIWDMPGHNPFPPYLDSNGHPPANAPPSNPTVSIDVGGHGGRFGYTIAAPIETTLSIGFAASGLGARSSIARPLSPTDFAASPRDTHYGWPGAPPTDSGIYIQVDYACSTGRSSGGLGMPSRIRRRR
jgi:hypothetical protein